MIGVSTSSPSKLAKRRSKEQKIVYKLTKTAYMKFRPERKSQVQSTTSSGIFQRFRSLSRLVNFSGGSQKDAVRNSSKQKTSDEPSKTAAFDQLSYLFILDAGSYLIGNKTQLDAISLTLVQDYIEAEHLWTFKLKSPILHMLVDSKRKSIVAVVEGQILLFGYESRKSKTPPQLIKQFKLLNQVKMIQFAKDSLLAVFFQNFANFYTVDGASSRQFSKKDYKVSKELTFYRAAHCVDGILNIFFTSPKQSKQSTKKLFTLWCLPLDFSGFNCEIGQVKAIYDVEQKFQENLKVESITRDCFLINLGKEIYMFKKGYCVDKVAVNYHDNNTILKYFSDRKLVHVSPTQIDFYNVVIDLVSNPPKIQLKSTDSIVVPERKGKYLFMDVLRFEEHTIGFFYQIPAPNLTGEVKYEFVLTSVWDYFEKINSLLPKVNEFKGERTPQNPQFQAFMQLIEQRCDSVAKMGMSRKEAYLHIWKQSGKSSVEEFKLLLDTLDYNTVREEITLKLKSKSMLWVQVHKIEQGCLGMLQQPLFSQTQFTIEGLKNYLISHLLIRKLEMFKQTKLYQKKAGKIKQADLAREGDKLMINIQQYTNVIQMDIKAHLLQLIYHIVKKKDYVTEIRILIRKFKFALRHIYLTLLKDIVVTAKEELHTLLLSIPQILPYVPLTQQQTPTDDTQSLSGVWGPLKQEQWQRALYLGQVCTVFNKDIVSQLSNSVWTKRNWLTYHDMVFLSRSDIESQFLVTQQSIFYNLLEHIYGNFKQQDKLRVIINHIQDFYVSFPQHLYNNVFLYRKLFIYFKENNFLNQPFSQFLRRRDEEIFKRIFDHQKHKKGSLLSDVKPIYEQLRQSDKFNNGLLKFFSSNLSEVSDIKYLLNRINNQKRQFHAENEEMYEVLIKGMQIKLKLGSERDIPIEQVLIYINKIPIQDNKFIFNELQVLQKLNEQHLNSLFKTMKINMSVFEIIRNRDTVLMKIIEHQINKADLNKHLNEEAINLLTQKTIKSISDVRQKIYGKFTDNDVIFTFIVLLMENAATVPFIHNIIQNLNKLESLQESPFTKNQLEAAVYYNYRKKTCEKPLYTDNQSYLTQIITLLEQDSILKTFITAQLEMVKTFTSAGLVMVYPLCGETGVISKRIIEGLIDSLSAEGLLLLDLQKIHDLQVTLQKCLGVSESSMSLYELYEKQIVCLLKKNYLKEASRQMELLFKVEPSNPDNIIYPILMFRHISCELIEENKQLMLSLITRMFNHPEKLLQFFKELTARAYSNDEQKELLNQRIRGVLSTADSRFNTQNMLFDEIFKEYLRQKPQKCEQVQKLLQQQYLHFLHSNHEYLKSIDLPVINLITLLKPQLLIKYVNRCFGVMNLRQVRCYLSYLSKYESFDCFKVLEFGKRLFKVLYFCEKDLTNLDILIAQNFEAPLSDIDNLSFLTGDTQNLSKLSKSIQKFRAKLKSKLNLSSSLKKRRSSSIEPTLQEKFAKLDVILSDFSVYLGTTQYPFADSDKQIDRQEIITVVPYKQAEPKEGIFDFRKYLLWMLKRTNQSIQYYLIKSNQAEVDAQMKKKEEALKLSFCRYPSDKNMKQNAPLVVQALQKTQQPQVAVEPMKELVPQGMPNLPHISAIHAVQGSAISALEFNPVEIEQIEQVFLGTSLLKDEILASVQITAEGKLTFKADLIRNYGTTYQLQHVIPQLLKEIYQDQTIEFNTAVELIAGIQLRFSKYTQINNQFLQIYKKIDFLHRKVSLEIPIRQLLPFAGLMLKQNDSQVLFYFLKDAICKQLTQTNILTVSKLFALAFKRQDINIQQILKTQFMKNNNIVI